MLAQRLTSVARSCTKARGFHSSAVISAGQKWRLSVGQARSGTEYGPLTDLPDWSYVDETKEQPGMTKAQARRARAQEKELERVDRLLHEIAVAVEQPKQ